MVCNVWYINVQTNHTTHEKDELYPGNVLFVNAIILSII
jgi:hypothetical protein